jgi:hypothetical protein
MSNINHFLNSLATGDIEVATNDFESIIHNKIADNLEVRKVELASSMFGVQQEEEELTEGAGMDAQRKWVRHVAAIGKGYEGTDRGHKVSVPRAELKTAARKYFQRYSPHHGVEFVKRGAEFVKDARKTLKGLKKSKEEVVNELSTKLLGRYIDAVQQSVLDDDGRVNLDKVYKMKKQHIKGHDLAWDKLGARKRKPKVMATEEVVNELSTKLKQRYMAKRGSQLSSFKYGLKHKNMSGRIQKNAIKGLKQANEAVNVNEVSSKLLGRYIDAVHQSILDDDGAVDMDKVYKMKKQREAGHKLAWEKLNARKKKAKVMATEETVDETLQAGSKPAPPSARNVITNIRRGIAALRIKGVNPLIASRAHADYARLVAKNPKAPGYMLLRKLAPNKAMAMQALTQAGLPVGGALDANPIEYNQALQRVKRFR